MFSRQKPFRGFADEPSEKKANTDERCSFAIKTLSIWLFSLNLQQLSKPDHKTGKKKRNNSRKDSHAKQLNASLRFSRIFFGRVYDPCALSARVDSWGRRRSYFLMPPKAAPWPRRNREIVVSNDVYSSLLLFSSFSLHLNFTWRKSRNGPKKTTAHTQFLFGGEM